MKKQVSRKVEREMKVLEAMVLEQATGGGDASTAGSDQPSTESRRTIRAPDL